MPRTLAENPGDTQGAGGEHLAPLFRLILNGDEHVAARRVEVLRELVFPVEYIVPPGPDRPLAVERVASGQVEQRVAVHSASLRLARLIEAGAARHDFAAQGPGSRGFAQPSAAEFLGAPRQHQSGRLVDWILQCDARIRLECGEGALVA